MCVVRNESKERDTLSKGRYSEIGELLLLGGEG